MKHISHIVWFARWLQRLSSSLMRRLSVIDLVPSFLAPRRRWLYDRRTGRVRSFRLRRVLADYWSYDQTLASLGLDLRRWPQGERLKQRYLEMLAAGRRPVVLDCGANIGCSTYWLATEFPLATVLAIEPDTANAALAEHNTRHCPNVRVLRAAVAASDCRLRIADAAASQDAFRTVPADEGDIQGYSVASLLELAGAPPADLLLAKIDIEGFEQQLFSHNTEWLAESGAIIVETHDWMLAGQASAVPLLRCLGALQRDFLVQGEHVMSFRIP
jgi:FkbM family methyltransferase